MYLHKSYYRKNSKIDSNSFDSKNANDLITKFTFNCEPIPTFPNAKTNLTDQY